MTQISSKKEKKHKKKKKSEDPWELQDFVQSMDQVMSQQERDYPPIRQVHARLTPEWKEVSEQVARLLSMNDEEGEKQLVEKIVDQGDMATRVLLDLLLSLKKDKK